MHILWQNLSNTFGNFKVLIFVVFIWIAFALLHILLQHAMQFYIVAAIVGLVMGGIQSLSRSTYAKIMPETHDTASFFSFYDVTEKIAIVIGMFTFGFVQELTGNMRNSIIGLVAFFFIGLIFLFATLKKQKLSFYFSCMKLYSIETGYFKLDGGAMFGVVPKSIWKN